MSPTKRFTVCRGWVAYGFGVVDERGNFPISKIPSFVLCADTQHDLAHDVGPVPSCQSR